MKVCFPVAVDNGFDSEVYNHFGSAPMFLVADTKSNTLDTLDNTNVHHAHGACNPVLALGEQKIEAIVVGGIGAGAFNRLNSMGLKVFQASPGTVEHNMELFKSGGLPQLKMSFCKSGHHEHGQGHSCSH